jgi:hypothetical protein
MKVLFFYIGTPSPILEIELELIKKHEKLGNIVHVVQCTGNLPNCHWNLDHNNSKCAVCRSQFKNGWNTLKMEANVILKHFPSVDSSRHLNFSGPLKSVKEITSYKYDNENIGYGTASSLISLKQDHRFDTIKHHNDVERSLRTSIEVYDALKKEIEEFCPDQVYLFNGRIGTHLPAKLICERLSLEYFSYEYARISNHYVLKKNGITHRGLLVEQANEVRDCWTLEDQAEGASLFKRMRYGDISGEFKNFLGLQEKNAMPHGFDYSKRNVVIFNGSLDEREGVEFCSNKLYQPDQTAGIARILASMASNSEFRFYLRCHPNMVGLPATNSQLVDTRDIDSRFMNVVVIWPEEIVDTYALMEACEKVITFGSSVGLEATYWGIPSILADHSLWENFDYAYSPNTHEELISLLQDDLQPKSPDEAVMAIISRTRHTNIPFEHFKESKKKNEADAYLFNGTKIQGSIVPRLWHWINILPKRLHKVMLRPSLLIKKFRSYM